MPLPTAERSQLFTQAEVQTLFEVLSRGKAKEIIGLLLTSEKGMYHNEIAQAVGGSKTTVANTLQALTENENKYLLSEWQIMNVRAAANPRMAVKVYKLSDDWKSLFKRAGQAGII